MTDNYVFFNSHGFSKDSGKLNLAINGLVKCIIIHKINTKIENLYVKNLHPSLLLTWTVCNWGNYKCFSAITTLKDFDEICDSFLLFVFNFYFLQFIHLISQLQPPSSSLSSLTLPPSSLYPVPLAHGGVFLPCHLTLLIKSQDFLEPLPPGSKALSPRGSDQSASNQTHLRDCPCSSYQGTHMETELLIGYI